MLRASDEPSPQVERSIRARLESRLAAPYNSERVYTDFLRYEKLITTLTEATIKDIPASDGADTEDSNVVDSKAVYEEILLSVGRAKERLLEIAARDEE
jgi:hypothetical protein